MIYCLILFIFVSCLILLLYTDKGQPSMWGSPRCPICFEPCHRIAFDGRLQNILHIGYSKDWTNRKDQNKRASQPFANFAFFPQFHLRRAISQDQPVTLEYYGIICRLCSHIDDDLFSFTQNWSWLQPTARGAHLPTTPHPLHGSRECKPISHALHAMVLVSWNPAGSSQRFQRTETAADTLELIELIEPFGTVWKPEMALALPSTEVHSGLNHKKKACAVMLARQEYTHWSVICFPHDSKKTKTKAFDSRSRTA